MMLGQTLLGVAQTVNIHASSYASQRLSCCSSQIQRPHCNVRPSVLECLHAQALALTLFRVKPQTLNPKPRRRRHILLSLLTLGKSEMSLCWKKSKNLFSQALSQAFSQASQPEKMDGAMLEKQHVATPRVMLYKAELPS